MGVWGEGPFDGDDSCAFVDELRTSLEDPLDDRRQTLYRLMKPIQDVVSLTTSRAADEYNRARAAIGFILFAHEVALSNGPDKRAPVMLEALLKIRADKEWINEWREPSEIRESVSRQIRAVKRLLP